MTFGICLSLFPKNERLKNYYLPFYPRYNLAEAARRKLSDLRYKITDEKGQEVKVAVLEIDDDSWEVMFDFLQSEIALRKSDRTKPGSIGVMLPGQSPKASKEDTSKTSVPINWDHVKTIFAVRLNVARIGPKPIFPPYRLTVTWRGLTSVDVYKFLSFKEFRLDMNEMLAKELEYYGLLLTLCAFTAGIALSLGRRWLLPKLKVHLQTSTNQKHPN